MRGRGVRSRGVDRDSPNVQHFLEEASNMQIIIG